MEFRQLEYVVAVAEEANFTKAAARLHVAQSGISAQIRQLEDELGQPLLDRSTRRVSLTTAGAAVLPYFRTVLKAIADARVVVDEFSGLMRGHVSVGMVTGCSSLEMASLLADFHHKHPAVEIDLSEANSDRLIEALRAGQLDMALVGLASEPPAGIETEVIADEAIIAAVSSRDIWVGQNTVTLKALQERTLISLPQGTGLRASLDNACITVGFRPRVAFEATSLSVLAQLAVRGLGVAILPESFAAAQGLHAVTITQPRLRGRIELAWKVQGPINPAAAALISDARTFFAAHTSGAATPIPRRSVKRKIRS